MKAVFDIFEIVRNDSTIWVEAVDGLDQARRRVRELSSLTKHEYFIYSERNGVIQREHH